MSITMERAHAELWRYPLKGSTGGSGITSVDLIVCNLESNDGHTGIGFSYVLGGGGEHVVQLANSMLDRFVLGQKLMPPNALWRVLMQSLNRLGRGSGYLAIAALDVAMWDLYAKCQGLPLGVSMGGTLREVPVYGSGGFGPNQDPAEAVDQALKYANAGATAVKLRFTGNASDFKRLDAVANAIPDDVGIMADLNEKCDLASALWLSNACAEYNLIWLEEPLPAKDIHGYISLASKTRVPIATGEHHQGANELLPFFEGHCCAIAQPDLAMMGGLTEILRVVILAEHFGISIAPHFLPSLFIHLAAVSPAITWVEDFPLLEPLFNKPAVMLENGMMMPSEVPGHGLSWASGAREEFKVRQ